VESKIFKNNFSDELKKNMIPLIEEI